MQTWQEKCILKRNGNSDITHFCGYGVPLLLMRAEWNLSNVYPTALNTKEVCTNLKDKRMMDLQLTLDVKIHTKTPLAQFQPLLERGRIDFHRLHPAIATVIVTAAGEGRSDLLALFLDHPIEQGDLNKALLSASKGWHKEIVQTLLQAGADIRTRDKDGGSPLISLMQGFRADRDTDKALSTARLLLEQGADRYAVDNKGSSALNALLDHVDLAHPLAQFLLASGVQIGLAEAAISGDAEKLTTLIAQATDAGEAPAMWSRAVNLNRIASRGYVDVMRILLRSVGDARSKLGDLGLHYAVHSGQTEMVRILLQNGAPLTPSYARGYLSVAISSGYTNLLRFWLDEYGLDTALANEGISFRYACAEHSHTETISLLLERADAECLVKWKLPQGLGLAARNGKVETVKLLLAFGTHVNRFYLDHTPLMFAAKAGHVEIVRLLLAAGANKQSQWNRGGQMLSVLGCAQVGGNPEILQMLQ